MIAPQWFCRPRLVLASLGAIACSAFAQTQITDYQYEYDAEGRLTKVTDPRSQQRIFTNDALGRLKTEKLPAAATGQAAPTIAYTVDGRDQVTAVQDPRNNTTTYTINGYGDNKKLSSPDSGVSDFTFNANGVLTQKTDARTLSASYVYDAMNRINSITYTSGVATVFQYGTTPYGRGQIGKITDESGSTSYRYNAFARISAKSQLVSAGGVERTFSVAYDQGTTGSETGKLKQLTYPSGARITYSYDANGRVQQLSLNPTNANGTGTNTGVTTTVLSAVSYAPMGGITGWTWGNSTAAQPNRVTRSYDLDGRIVKYSLGNALTTGVTRTVTYDAASRIKSTTHTGAATAASLNQTYDYDNLDRLTSFVSASTTQKYGYDAANNRVQSSFGASTVINTIAANSNRLTAATGPVRARTNQYDAAGNLISDGTVTYAYNAAGRMSSVTAGGVTTSMLYNGLGERVFKSGGAMFVYDEEGHLVGEYNITTGKPISEFVYIGDQPVAMLRQTVSGVAPNQTTATDIYYIHTDHINAPRLVTQASNGAIRWRWDDTDPYGMLPPNENPAGAGVFVLNLRMPGQYYDKESNLYYNYYRDYDPQTGRYVQSDPIGLKGGINTYGYAAALPTAQTDRLGLAPRRLPYDSRECSDLRQKISNKKIDINKRIQEIARNEKLPYYPPYPGALPRFSAEGHEGIIRDLKDGLKDDQKLHDDKCGDPPAPSPQPICGTNCQRVLKSRTDAVTGAILFVFVLVCSTS